VELHVYEHEGHGLYDERNRIDFYTKLPDFFLRQMPPGPAPASTHPPAH